MQINSHAITPSQDGSAHSRVGSGCCSVEFPQPCWEQVIAAAPCTCCRGSCVPGGEWEAWQLLCITATMVPAAAPGAGPSSRCTKRLALPTCCRSSLSAAPSGSPLLLHMPSLEFPQPLLGGGSWLLLYMG